MESDRFDDVDFQMIEAPEPPPRRRRRGIVAIAAVFAAGALAAGASALASGDEPTPPAAAPSVPDSMHFRHHDGRGCHHHGQFRGSDRDTSLRY